MEVWWGKHMTWTPARQQGDLHSGSSSKEMKFRSVEVAEKVLQIRKGAQARRVGREVRKIVSEDLSTHLQGLTLVPKLSLWSLAHIVVLYFPFQNYNLKAYFLALSLFSHVCFQPSLSWQASEFDTLARVRAQNVRELPKNNSNYQGPKMPSVWGSETIYLRRAACISGHGGMRARSVFAEAWHMTTATKPEGSSVSKTLLAC